MNAKKACLTYLVLLVGIGACLDWIFSKASPISAFLPSAIGSLVLTFGILYIHGAVKHAGEMRMVGRSLSAEPFGDGERVAVVGPISPIGAPIETPFTHRPCVAYEYEIFRWVPGSETSRKMRAYFGFALTPSTIATPRGRVAVLACPLLDFGAIGLTSESDYANALRYVESTQFTGVARGSLEDAWRELKDLITDDDGSVRKDLASETENFNIRDFFLSEKVLEVGENICAFGRYSAAREGLVPDPKTMAHGVAILHGTADSMMATIRKRFLGYAIGGSALLLFGVGGVLLYLRWLKTTIGAG